MIFNINSTRGHTGSLLVFTKWRLVVHFFGHNDILLEKRISLYNFKFRRLLVCLFKSSIQFVSEYN